MGQERRLLLPRERGDLALDPGRPPAEPGLRPSRHRLEPKRLRQPRSLGDGLLVEVQAVEDRLLGEEVEAADRLGLLGVERERTERRLGLERRLQPAKDLLLLRLRLLPLL